MARTVRDAAHLLQAIAGLDPADNYTSAIPGPVPDYLAGCSDEALQGARIGVPYNVFAAHKEQNPEDPVHIEFDKALKTLEAAGATLVVANFTKPQPDERTWMPDAALTSQADLMANLPNYFAQLTENPFQLHAIADLRDKTLSSSAEQAEYWDTAIWDQALQLGFDNTNPRYWLAWQRLQKLQGPDGVLGAIERNQVQAIVLPAMFATGTANHIGAPVVTVPLGYDPVDSPLREIELPEGRLFSVTGPSLSFGLSFVGRHWSEADLIRFAYGFEQKTRVRARAKHVFEPTAEITVSPSC